MNTFFLETARHLPFRKVTNSGTYRILMQEKTDCQLLTSEVRFPAGSQKKQKQAPLSQGRFRFGRAGQAPRLSTLGQNENAARSAAPGFVFD